MTSYLAPAAASWSSVMLHLNSQVAEPVAVELSRLSSCPVIVFFEYDQTTWGFCLFENSKLLDRFWSLPHCVEIPPNECAGNVTAVSNVFEIPAEAISSYMRHVSEGDYGIKAFDDDEFTLDDHWVRVDFMRRLGLSYPNPGRVAGGRHVQIQEPRP
jgi:hypothetical protein